MGEVGNLITWSCNIWTYYWDMIDVQLEKVLTEFDNNPNLDYNEKDEYKESLRSHLDYLERNYIGRRVRTGQSKARFEPEVWNQVQNCLEGRPLSTNRNEGFHSR